MEGVESLAPKDQGCYKRGSLGCYLHKSTSLLRPAQTRNATKRKAKYSKSGKLYLSFEDVQPDPKVSACSGSGGLQFGSFGVSLPR